MREALGWQDWLVIGGYFALILSVGIRAASRIQTTGDYFLGSRRFGVWVMLGQSFGVGTHAEMPVSLAGAVYAKGYSAIWYQWKNLFITPFYWILAPLFRRFRKTTIGEVYDERFGPVMGVTYSLFALLFFILSMGSMLKGAGKLVSAATGGALPPNTVALGMAVAFVAYSVVGGLVAAAWTDVVQSVFILLLSFMLIPFGFAAVGGGDGLRQRLDPSQLSLVTPGDIGIFTIGMLTINGLIGIVAQPHILASVGTGRDETACRVGFTYGNFLKRLCAVGWALVGLIVFAMVQGSGAELVDPEEAFGYATRQLLFPGAVGLMISCVLAANMSTCSAMMVDGGALFVRNLYGRYFVRDRADRHYLAVGRLAGVALTISGIGFALWVDSVLQAFLVTETIAAFMGISMFGAVCWRRANGAGALASFVVASVVFFLLTRLKFGVLLRWDPTVFGVSMLAGFVALVAGSLYARAPDSSRLDAFYQQLRTPSAFDNSSASERTVDEAGHELLLVNLGSLGLDRGWREFVKRFRVDLVGLLAACGIVACLILFARAVLAVM